MTDKRDELEVIVGLLISATITASVAADRLSALNDQRGGDLLKLFAAVVESAQVLNTSIRIGRRQQAIDRKKRKEEESNHG